MPISRREFLKKSAQSSAAISFAFGLSGFSPAEVQAEPSVLNKWPGRAVVNYNRNATTGSSGNQEVIKSMVNDAIKLLTGQATVGEAWKAIFPVTLTAASKIAIKVNLLNSNTPTHPHVVKGITDGLQEMNINGTAFPAANITLYDNYSFSNSGYTLSLFPGISMLQQGDWAWKAHGDGAFGDAIYADALYNADFLINVPVLKGHGSSVGGVTLGFKNHYGTYTPGCYAANGDHHSYLQTINCTGPVFNKTVLTIVSAIFAQLEMVGPDGVPQNFLTYARTRDASTSNPNPNTLILSTDPVTAEFQGIKIQKIQGGKPYTVNDMPDYLRASAGISGVLSTTYNIGELNETQMACGEIVNGETTIPLNTSVSRKKPSATQSADWLRIPVNPSSAPVCIESLIHDVPTRNVNISIYTIQGRMVWQFPPVSMNQNRFSWAGTDMAGRAQPAGEYVVRAITERTSLSSRFILLR